MIKIWREIRFSRLLEQHALEALFFAVLSRGRFFNDWDTKTGLWKIQVKNTAQIASGAFHGSIKFVILKLFINEIFASYKENNEYQ